VFWGCREAITLPTSWYVGGVPSGGDTSSFLWKRSELVPECIKRMCYKLWNTILFNDQEWVFQQYSASAHKAKTTQEWLQRNLLAFISTENWPSESPDLNSLDWKPWVVLKDMACQKQHNNLESLKRSLLKAVAEIPLETVRAVTAQRPERLKACVEAEGSHFEWHYYKWKIRTIANKLFGLKSGNLFNFPSRSYCTCNRTYGKTAFLQVDKLYVWDVQSFRVLHSRDR